MKISADIIDISNVDVTVISANSNVAICTDGDSSGGLGVWVLTKSRGSVSFGLSGLIGNLMGTNSSSLLWIPGDDLVVVS